VLSDECSSRLIFAQKARVAIDTFAGDKTMNRIVGGFILFGICLVVVLGCPLLPVNIFDDPADPGSGNYQGYPLIDDMDEIEGCIEDGAHLAVPRFIVSQVKDAQAYRLQVATDAEFVSVVYDEDGFAGNVMDADDLEVSLTKSLEERYWRACAKAGDTWGTWGEVRSFVYMHPNTVYFDAQDGTVPNPQCKAVVEAQPYGVLPTSTRTGYFFSGWWTEVGGDGDKITDTSIVGTNKGHILYAGWRDYSTHDYAVKEIGPAGGYIFYENPNWDTDG